MSHNHQISMAGGTVSGIVASISTADVLTTCILAAIGAVVRYLISMMMKQPFGIRTSLDDLEQHLEQHQLSARVVGIDQHIVACTTTSASEADIIAALVKKSGLPAALFAVKQVDDFPRLPTGKIDYKKLHALALYDVLRPLSVAEVMAMFIRRTLQESLSILTGHGATWQSVAEIFQIHFPAHTVLPTDSFASLSGDSLIHVQVSLALEDYLGHLPHNWHTLSLLDLEKLLG